MIHTMVKMAVATLFIVTFVVGAQTTATPPTRTCLPKGVQNSSGFEICFLNKTGTVVTEVVGISGNTLWSLQTKLEKGNCYCNQDCQPPQIVCEDSQAIQNLNLDGYSFLFNTPVGNVLAQMTYMAINYKVHCFCPQYAQENNICGDVAQPKQCYTANPSPYADSANTPTTAAPTTDPLIDAVVKLVESMG